MVSFVFFATQPNDEDVALFHQAEQLANDGRADRAYPIFCTLRDRGNQEIEILFWIVQTTPNIISSRQVLDEIKRREPNHPLIPRSEQFHQRKLETAPAYVPPGPALLCPYCGVKAPALVKSKISIGGWVWFAACFLLTLGGLFALVPIAQVDAMGKAAWFFLIVGIAGLFAIRKRVYLCGHCGSRISDAG